MNLTDVTPNLIVSDIDRSTAFYRDVLGFSVVTTVPETGALRVRLAAARTASACFSTPRRRLKDELPNWARGRRPAP